MTWVLSVVWKRLSASRFASKMRLFALVDTLLVLCVWKSAGNSLGNELGATIKIEGDGARIADDFRHPFGSLNLD